MQLPNSNIFRFSHSAMATIFEVLICHDEEKYARQAAYEAFFELDRLEQDLSRFIENSDISRINNLTKNEKTRISPDTFECLISCAELFVETNGAFNITVGSLMNVWLDKEKKILSPSDEEIRLAKQQTGLHHILMDESDFSVTIIGNPVQLDFGGFGKGYAVDKMADLLNEWSINKFLIHGGKSSVFASGAPQGKQGWNVSISNPYKNNQLVENILLKNKAMSGSGLKKGFHIIDPRTAQPIKTNRAAWTFAQSAAVSDALSTAFLIMDSEEVNKYCINHPEVKAIIIKEEKERKTCGEKILKYGDWQQ